MYGAYLAERKKDKSKQATNKQQQQQEKSRMTYKKRIKFKMCK